MRAWCGARRSDAKGAFTAFSKATAQLLVARVGEDEEFVRRNRSSVRLTNPYYGIHHRFHPRNLILLEDVYYCCALQRPPPRPALHRPRPRLHTPTAHTAAVTRLGGCCSPTATCW